MKTLRLDASKPADVERAAELVRQGKLVAFPTETVYGLGARGLDIGCVGAIYEAKGRPPENPLILHVPSLDAALPLWRQRTDAERRGAARAAELAHRFWPGPLTLVSYASEAVPRAVTAGLDTVAVRCPSHPVARRLLELAGEPLAAPSANASGRVSATSARDVLESLDGRIDAVLDAGPCPLGIESTVLDVTASPPAILRAGALDEARLRAALPDLTHGAGDPASGGPRPSPGMLSSHYAPRIARRSLAAETDLTRAWPSAAGLLVRRATHERLTARLGPRPAGAPHEALADDAAGFARELYAALYRLERAAPEALYIEAPPSDPVEAWRAVRDRLARATA